MENFLGEVMKLWLREGILGHRERRISRVKVTLMRVNLLTVALLLSCSVGAFGANSLSNRRAPGFALPDLQLKYHDLADYRGRVVVVNVMKVGCPHCTTLSKVLTAAEKKYGSRLKVLSIVNPPDNQTMVRGYMIKNQISNTILFDCGQVAASYLQVTPSNPSVDVPHFFVIDKDGMIREDYGYNQLQKDLFEGEGIYKILDKYVSKPGVAQAGGRTDAD